jgi:hypothetical protein
LTFEVTNHLNFFPPYDGISPYFSPRHIVERRNLDYVKHCSIPMFTYVQATEDRPATKNTIVQSRTLDALYLRPSQGTQPGHEVLHLGTMRQITQSHVIPFLPMTPSVISAVETAAKVDVVKKTVIRSKHGQIFYDCSWIAAGVDYTNNFNDDDVYAESDYERC